MQVRRALSRPRRRRCFSKVWFSRMFRSRRAIGALRNEGENAPYFLALAVIHALIGGPPVPLLGISSLYVMARLFQGYAQVRALQPQRMIGYLTGAVATLCLAVLIALRMVV